MLKHKMREIVIAISAFAALILLFFIACSATDLPVIQPRLEGASVYLDNGTWNRTFNYSVNCSFSKKVTITLEVYNLSLHDWWEPPKNGTYTYDGTGERKTLTWNNIKICSDECAGTSRYRFKYKGSVLKDVNEKEIHYGPGIKTVVPTPTPTPALFKNATVVPSVGEYDTLFNYSVEIVNVTAVNPNNVTVVVWNPHTLEEPEFKNATSDDSRLKWSIKPFEDDTQCKGFAGYYFRYNGKRWPETVLCYGPAINMTGPPGPSGSGGGGGGGYYGPWITYENATVDPNWVLIGLRDEKKTFNYSVIVNRGGTLILEIYNLSSNEWEEFGEGKKREGVQQMYEWTVNLTLDKNWYGICKYQFYPKDRKTDASQIYYGPEISSKEERMIAWKEEIGVSDKRLKKPIIECTVMPKEERWFKKFTYTALINHPDRVNMTLALFVYKPGSKDWELVPWKPYKDNAIIREDDYENGAASVKWTSEGIFDKKDVNKPPYRYYIWYWDGYNEDRDPFTGPHDVTENHEPSVKGSVTPESGTFLTTFEYTAYIRDKDGDDTVIISLYVKDPSDRTVLIGEKTVKIKGGKGNATWVVPSDEYPQKIFTAENLGNESFNSSFYFEYSDEGMEIMGEGKITSDPIPGPDVKPADVTFIIATVSPETGKYSDKFTYKAEFYSSESNTITATLRIYDPSNPLEWNDFTANESGTGTIYITWSKVSPEVFGPEDFDKTGSYSIAWRDKILQTKEKEEGPWHGPHINVGIPILGGVALPLALIIVVPLVIPAMLFVSPFIEKIKRRRES